MRICCRNRHQPDKLYSILLEWPRRRASLPLGLIERDLTHLLPSHVFPAPLELIAVHMAISELGMVLWWLESGQSYEALYVAQTSYWLSLVGIIQGLKAAERLSVAVPSPPNAIPEKD